MINKNLKEKTSVFLGVESTPLPENLSTTAGTKPVV
jgi:hypothetical protein